MPVTWPRDIRRSPAGVALDNAQERKRSGRYRMSDGRLPVSRRRAEKARHLVPPPLQAPRDRD